MRPDSAHVNHQSGGKTKARLKISFESRRRSEKDGVRANRLSAAS